MRFLVVGAAVSGLFLSVLATPMAVAVPEPAALEERAAAKCALCVAQCAGFIALCIAACGPGEIFGPEGCANCLVIAGASQQCFQCVEKCEESGDLAATGLATNCDHTAYKPYACNGIDEPSVGEYGGPGVCTIDGYAKDGSSGVGVTCPAGQSCDVAVGLTRYCAPVATA